jgi:chromosomal replication initiator protein
VPVLRNGDVSNPWSLVKQHLAGKISNEGYQNWVATTSFRGLAGKTIYVSVPNEAAKVWLEQEYAQYVKDALSALRLPALEIVYELETAHNGRNGKLPFNGRQSMNGMDSDLSPAQLNPKFSFDSFVVGACNQFAHAAARAVAERPTRSYNPLFVYGHVGMGKTHLAHAIGQSLLERYPDMRVVYVTSERFMNEMIQCIRLDRMTEFHHHYRMADVLLIDDIELIAGRERTQEEFFHTFNELYEHQKQIVITSDSPPKEIKGLVDRLRSRFEWGLMVDIQPPDLETKMAILDKKAGDENIVLPEDVRIYIATKTKSNIRELEGALVKLMAYSSLSGCPINLAMAKQVLSYLTQNQSRKPTIDAIIRAVAERFNLPPADLKKKSNRKAIAQPRQIAMYLAKELTSASLTEIGRAFGGKHHTTVLHSIRKVEAEREADLELNRLVLELLDLFQ